MFMAIASVVVVALAGLLVFAATKPRTFRVQRAMSIRASRETIFAVISDFRKWGLWSPWETKDPAMTRTFSGAASGTGSVYEWKGNKEVGQGRMEIIETVAPSKVTIKLDFIRPFEAHNFAEFTLDSQDRSTEVTWAMHGPLPYMAKVMSVVCDMDRMVGKDFERGLANLKGVTEKEATANLAASAG